MAVTLFNLYLCFLTICAVEVATYKNVASHSDGGNRLWLVGSVDTRSVKATTVRRRPQTYVFTSEELAAFKRGVTPKPLADLELSTLCRRARCRAAAPACGLDRARMMLRKFPSACHLVQYNHCAPGLRNPVYDPVDVAYCKGVNSLSRLWFRLPKTKLLMQRPKTVYKKRPRNKKRISLQYH